MRHKSKLSQEIFTDVIIVGGGHSGLSLAACLGTAGIDVVCLERGEVKPKNKSRGDGRTLALSYSSMELLRKAAVAATILPQACPILDIRIADQDSPHYLDFHHQQVGDNPFGWIIENNLFHAALEKRLGQLKNVRMIYGARIAQINCDDNEASIMLEDGRAIKAQLIVGADGRKSLCRESAGIETYGWNYHQTALVCTIKHSLPHNNVAVEHFQPGGPFATLPMTKQRSSIVWTEKTDAANALTNMSMDEFKVLLQDRVKDYLGNIELLGQRYAFPLNLQHAKHYIAKRLALIGDAAHGIHPIAGQGFNLGMGDIEVLTEEVTKAFYLGLDFGSPLLLKRFEKRRKADNGNMVLATDLLDRLFSTAAPPVQALRRFGLGVVQQLPPLQNFFMRTAMGANSGSVRG